MLEKENVKKSLVVILSFLIALYGKRILNSFFTISFNNEFVDILYGYMWWLVPVFVVTSSLFGLKNVLNELKLNKGIKTGFLFALLTVSPMLIAYVILGNFNNQLNALELIRKTILAGAFEEVLFRGFLFGLLFRKFKWSFLPAVLIGAFVFGIAHVYQGNSLIEAMGIFAVTFLGAVWFSWLFVKWDYNLWVPIFVHILMNFSWIAFNISETGALGGYYANIFRILTIVFSIIITIVFNKRKESLETTNKNMLLNKV